MCVYLTYVLPTHTTSVALKATGACVFLPPGLCGTPGAEQSRVTGLPDSLTAHLNVASPSLSFQLGCSPAQHQHGAACDL